MITDAAVAEKSALVLAEVESIPHRDQFFTGLVDEPIRSPKNNAQWVRVQRNAFVGLPLHRWSAQTPPPTIRPARTPGIVRKGQRGHQTRGAGRSLEGHRVFRRARVERRLERVAKALN